MPVEPLRSRLQPLPRSRFSDGALAHLRDAAERQEALAALDAILAEPGIPAFLGSALGDCPFLLDLAAKDLSRLAAVLDASPEDRLARQNGEIVAAAWDTRPDAMAALRKAKQNVALTLGLADLGRSLSLEQVTEALTCFADAALEAALRFALAEAGRTGKWTGGSRAHGFVLLAMGKYGANELNYSSDIDLIALFDPQAPGPAEGVEPAVFWVKIVRTLVALMQERTPDGYVFRTDLRLRPDPAATPVALSAPAALLYYESMGQNWERAALIKARPAAGDLAAGERFLREIAPFIWRKYLDFAAIADIHSIKRQVHAHRGHETVRVPGHDIKRGRGGIREIEFFAQTQQLIAGGRDRSLRGRQTRGVLERLAAKGWIDQTTRRELDAAYVMLRTVEHRLQMVRDEQTHTLPPDREGLARIGRLMGYGDPQAFEADLRRTLETVAVRYSQLFEDAPDLSAETGSLVFTGGDDDPDTIETLRRLGFQEPQQVTATVRGWHFGRFAAMRSTAAREALTEIAPALLQAFARAGNPDAALRAFDDMLKALPAGAQLFALLDNNRQLLDLLATILAAAPRLAENFARHPHVADALLDPAGASTATEQATLEDGLTASLAEAVSFEEVLNRARIFAAERRFFISVGLLQGKINPAEAGKAFSNLAEAVVRTLFDHTLAEFERQHGRLPEGRAAILAFGRLGSREMTAGSDLDLIVIYDHALEAGASDGRRPLPPSQYYTRLTQRLTAALAAPTAEGIAYQVDLRLRPSGRAGPLATHVEAFQHYQLNDAWTWEHMAISRGRAIAGDADLVRRISAALDLIVDMPRDRDKLAADIADMRARLDRERPAVHAFDVKLARGGLIDCEFAAQHVVLSGLGRSEGESVVEILCRALGCGQLAGAVATPLIAAASVQGAILQVLRVADNTAADPERVPDALARLLATAVSAGLDEAASACGKMSEPADLSWRDGWDADASIASLRCNLLPLQDRARRALEAVLGRPLA